MMASVTLWTGGHNSSKLFDPPSQDVSTHSQPNRDADNSGGNPSGLRKRVSQAKTAADLHQATQTIAASGQRLPAAVPLQEGGKVGEVGISAVSRGALSQGPTHLTPERIGLSDPSASVVKTRRVFTLEQLKALQNPTTAQSVYLMIGIGIEKASKLATHPVTNYAFNLYFNYDPSQDRALENAFAKGTAVTAVGSLVGATIFVLGGGEAVALAMVASAAAEMLPDFQKIADRIDAKKPKDLTPGPTLEYLLKNEIKRNLTLLGALQQGVKALSPQRIVDRYWESHEGQNALFHSEEEISYHFQLLKMRGEQSQNEVISSGSFATSIDPARLPPDRLSSGLKFHANAKDRQLLFQHKGDASPLSVFENGSTPSPMHLVPPPLRASQKGWGLSGFPPFSLPIPQKASDPLNYNWTYTPSDGKTPGSVNTTLSFSQGEFENLLKSTHQELGTPLSSPEKTPQAQPFSRSPAFHHTPPRITPPSENTHIQDISFGPGIGGGHGVRTTLKNGAVITIAAAGGGEIIIGGSIPLTSELLFAAGQAALWALPVVVVAVGVSLYQKHQEKKVATKLKKGVAKVKQEVGKAAGRFHEKDLTPSTLNKYSLSQPAI